MEHFYQNIHGWFDFQDIYLENIQRAKNNAHFVEVGSWLGRSAAFMAVEIINSKKKIKFDCVDLWNGIGAEKEYDQFDKIKPILYDIFSKNLESVKDYYTPIKEYSDKAAELYKNKSLDFVFIDAGHEYEFIHADIKAWLPKVKKGGVIAGHDIYAPGVKRAAEELVPGYIVKKSSWLYQN